MNEWTLGCSQGSMQDSPILREVDVFAIEKSLYFLKESTRLDNTSEIFLNSFHSNLLMSVIQDNILKPHNKLLISDRIL